MSNERKSGRTATTAATAAGPYLVRVVGKRGEVVQERAALDLDEARGKAAGHVDFLKVVTGIRLGGGTLRLRGGRSLVVEPTTFEALYDALPSLPPEGMHAAGIVAAFNAAREKSEKS